MLESVENSLGNYKTVDAHLIFRHIEQLCYEARVCLNVRFTETLRD